MQPRWRAVYCKPRQEDRAEVHLRNQAYDAYLPRVRARRRLRGRDRTVIEPMFPRYLFVRLADYREDFGPIRSTRGVIGLVRMGEDFPTVPDELIAALRRREDPGGAIDLTAYHGLMPGEPVEITAGPFAGYQGLFDAASGEQRVVVLLEILNRQRRVEIPASDVRRA